MVGTYGHTNTTVAATFNKPIGVKVNHLPYHLNAPILVFSTGSQACATKLGNLNASNSTK